MHQGTTDGVIGRRAVRTAAIVLAACVAFTGCAAGTAASKHYRPVNFDGYDTFAWATDGGLVGVADADTQTVARVRESVERKLRQRGLRPAGADEPADLLLAFTLGSRADVGPQAYPEQLRGPWRWRGLEDARAAGYAPGTLAIDMFDAAAGQPVWHGWSLRPLSAQAEAPIEEAVTTTVASILRRYPPRTQHGLYLGSSYSVFGAPGT